MIALGHDNNVTLYLGSDAVLKAYLGTELVYPNTTPSYDTQYLTFEAIDNGTSFQFNQNGLEYSLDDGSTWNSLGASVDTPSLNTGDKIMFRGNMSITKGYGIGQFSSNGHFNIEGNPLSLVDDTNFADITDFTGMNQIFFQLFYGTDVVDASNLALPATTLSQDCYTSMFEGCTSLVTAPALPATTLAEYCYNRMFNGCRSLTTAPELPATTLAEYCYSYMFSTCTSLTTAPELPATTLTSSCYQSMFYGCTGLTTAPALPATTLGAACYNSMFQGCTGLTTAPVLPATTLTSSCYQSMFYGCTGLTTAPALPATTLGAACYNSMFQGCTGLTTAPALPATTLASGCYNSMFSNTNIIPDCSNIDFTSQTVVSSGGLSGLFAGTKITDADLERILPKNANGKYCLPVTTLASGCYSSMFNGCTSLTTAPVLPATTLANRCYGSMFNGCTSLTTAPVLPATTLVSHCYDNMFYGCTNVNYIKAMFTTTPSSTYTSNWVRNVSATGTFVKNSSATWNVTGANGVPSGWTIQRASQ